MFNSFFKMKVFNRLLCDINKSYFTFNYKFPISHIYSKLSSNNKYFHIGLFFTISSASYLNNKSYQDYRPQLYFDKVYELVSLKIIGKGAFSQIMRCNNRVTKNQAAVKIVSDDYNEAIREKEAIKYIQFKGGHENIIKLSDYFIHDGFHYLVIEYIDGNSLFDKICKKSLDNNTIYHIIDQISNALDFMHKHGIVHCDLKPDNIMITNKSYIVKLIDFGSATIPNLRSNIIYSKNINILKQNPESGTKQHWPPEMCLYEQVSPAMDMWAIGCILFIMLTGQHPFDLKGNLSDSQIIEAICKTTIKFTHPIWINVSSDIKNIILRLLDKNPKTRMTASELHICIKNLLNK